MFDSGVEADTFFRLEAGIVGEGKIEAVGSANSGAETPVEACGAEPVGRTGFAENVGCGDPRIHLRYGRLRQEGPPAARVGRKRIGSNVVDTKPGG